MTYTTKTQNAELVERLAEALFTRYADKEDATLLYYHDGAVVNFGKPVPGQTVLLHDSDDEAAIYFAEDGGAEERDAVNDCEWLDVCREWARDAVQILETLAENVELSTFVELCARRIDETFGPNCG